MIPLVSLKLKKNEPLKQEVLLNTLGIEIISKWENNHLTGLPSHLKKVILNVKDLTFQKGIIDKCTQLEYLRINGAIIPILDLPLLEKLKTLIISKSSISKIDISFPNLKNLEILDLSGNNIQELPLSLDMPNLKRINLDNNQLTDLPDWLYKLQKLNHLSLDENPLSDDCKQKIYECFKIIY